MELSERFGIIIFFKLFLDNILGQIFLRSIYIIQLFMILINSFVFVFF